MTLRHQQREPTESDINGSIKAESLLASLRSGVVPVGLEDWVSKTLDHPVWSIRNIAVKAVQLAELEQFSPTLCKLVADPREIGFIRRNATQALGQMGKAHSETLKTLDNALLDAYWEVRASAARSITLISPPDQNREHMLISLLFKKTPERGDVLPLWRPNRVFRERNFEVREAMTQALGTVSVSIRAIWAIRLLLQDDNWKVRKAGLQAVADLHDTHPSLRVELAESLKDTDLSSTDFQPFFPIRKTWNSLRDILEKNTVNTKRGGS